MTRTVSPRRGARSLAGVVLAAVLALLVAPLSAPAAAAARTLELAASSPSTGRVVESAPGDASAGVRGLEASEQLAPGQGLAGPPTRRRLGLPVAVAVVALVGAASLVVRVLLAEPPRR